MCYIAEICSAKKKLSQWYDCDAEWHERLTREANKQMYSMFEQTTPLFPHTGILLTNNPKN